MQVSANESQHPLKSVTNIIFISKINGPKKHYLLYDSGNRHSRRALSVIGEFAEETARIELKHVKNYFI